MAKNNLNIPNLELKNISVNFTYDINDKIGTAERLIEEIEKVKNNVGLEELATLETLYYKAGYLETKARKIIELENEEDYFIKSNYENFFNKQERGYLKSRFDSNNSFSNHFKKVKDTVNENIRFLNELQTEVKKSMKQFESQDLTEQEFENSIMEVYNKLNTFVDTTYKKDYELVISDLKTDLLLLNDFDFDIYDSKLTGYKKYV